MATWRTRGGQALGRRPWRALLVTAAAVFLAVATPSRAVHEPVGSCSPGFENVRNVDLETFFDGKANLTICLGGNLEDMADHNVKWSNMSHVTVRSAPGSWRAIRSRIWIDESSSDVTLSGLTLDSSGYDGATGYAGLAVNGDRVALRRNLITNRYGPAGSCVINDRDFGVADDVIITQNRIFDCGRDETHDHGIYTNAMNRPIVTANWIYENAGRGINLGPYTTNGRFTRNVVADNCADPLGGTNDCSANVIFFGLSSYNPLNNNTIALPRSRYNLAGCDFGPDTPDCPEWTGHNNNVTQSCFYTEVKGYSGDPLGSGISAGWDEKYGRVDHTSITVADPQFADHTTPAHAWRNYRIPAGNPCAGYQPAGPVGPPG
jgi:hypothetical protein